jgi:hypothetical protein
MSDWAFDVLLGAVTLGVAVAARLLWRRGRTQTATVVALLVPFLVAIETLMIWYTVTGGGAPTACSCR